MKQFSVCILAVAVVATCGLASAQSYPPSGSLSPGYYQQPYPDTQGSDYASNYDYARVLRVDPVLASHGSGYGGYDNRNVSDGRQCYERSTYASDDDRYGNNPYYSNDYSTGRYQDRYPDRNSYQRSTGSEGGRTIAKVIGGVLGAVVGSQVGGGSARYATSAVGSMVGGIAGREVYEQSHRQQPNRGTTRVCDPVPGDYGDVSAGQAVTAYDVTYEYAGRSYTTRTNYHPGDHIRVRVDVRPE